MRTYKTLSEKIEAIEKAGKEEDFLNPKIFRNIKIFLKKEPKNVLFTIPHKNKIVYVGTD